eukprot:NODE_5164_length_1802_cov_7.048358.p1 GENE.NODE_5164_length_1802_cov_7.048358~~NODE_5164_length_1802_cov_7.048358.p1  ORF type:complete len:511 (+),score=79.87 NODE_5164_length_1802_cov_7.048358:182-1534(+)
MSWIFIPSLILAITTPSLALDPNYPKFTTAVVEVCQSMFFVGWSVSSLFAGPIGDRWGRKKPALALATLQVVSLALASAAVTLDSPIGLNMAMFALGMGTSASPCFTLLTLEAQPKADWDKVVAHVFCIQAGYSTIVPYFAGYVIRSLCWPLQLIICCAPYLLTCLGVALLVHESVPWLISQGRTTEAVGILAKIAAFNGVDMPPVSHPLLPKEPIAMEIDDIETSPKWVVVFASAITWAASRLSHIGLTYSAGNLSPHFYDNCIYLGVVDIIGYGLSDFLLANYGALTVQAHSFLWAAVCLLVCSQLPSGSWPMVGAALCGRLFINFAVATTPSLIPRSFVPSFRSTALGICNVSARTASLAAPLLALLPASDATLFFAILCLASVTATCFGLPWPQRTSERHCWHQCRPLRALKAASFQCSRIARLAAPIAAHVWPPSARVVPPPPSE